MDFTALMAPVFLAMIGLLALTAGPILAAGIRSARQTDTAARSRRARRGAVERLPR